MKKFLRKIAFAAVALTATSALAADWTCEPIATDGSVRYYIYNVGTQTYLNDDNTLSNAATTLWTVNGQNIVSANGKYIRIWETHTEKYNAGKAARFREYTFHVETSSTTSVSLTISNQGSHYLIGAEVEDYYKKPLIGSATTEKHVHYMVVNGASLNADGTSVSDNNGRWIFVSETAYELVGKEKDLADEKDDLQSAIDVATARLNALIETEGVPQSILNALENRIAAAKNMYDNATVNDIAAVTAETAALNHYLDTVNDTVNVLGTTQSAISSAESLMIPSAAKTEVNEKIGQWESLCDTVITDQTSLDNFKNSIAAYTNELNGLVAAVAGLKPYYMEGLYCIENCSKILDEEALNAAAESLEACTSNIQMLDVVLGLRSQAINYLNNLDGWYWPDSSVDISGVLLNPSFEMNDLTGWHAYRKPPIGSASTEFSSGTKVVSTSGSVTNGHGDYHLVCGSESAAATSGGHMVYQIISGLPVGTYTASGVVTDINVTVAGHKAIFTAIVAPVSLFGGGSGAPRKVRTFSDDEVLARLSDVMDDSKSTVTNSTINESSGTSMQDASVNFEVKNPGDVVLLGYTAGNLAQGWANGNYPYRADNLKLAMTGNVWTGVEDVIMDQEAEQEEVYFDLQGRRVLNPERGIYICNGRKILK